MLYTIWQYIHFCIFLTIWSIFIIIFIIRNLVQIYVLLIVIVTYNILNNIFTAQ
jgi:hypothetical protein